MRSEEVRYLPRQVDRRLELVLEIAEALRVRLASLVRVGLGSGRGLSFRLANPCRPGAQGLQILVVITVPLDEVKELGAVFLPVILVQVERRPLAANDTELHAQERRQEDRLASGRPHPHGREKRPGRSRLVAVVERQRRLLAPGEDLTMRPVRLQRQGLQHSYPATTGQRPLSYPLRTRFGGGPGEPSPCSSWCCRLLGEM